MAAKAEAPETPTYEVLQVAFRLSKSGWLKLKEYPVLASALPKAETAMSAALAKAGVDSFDAFLADIDRKYVDPVAETTLKTVETTKDTVKAKYDAMGSRKGIDEAQAKLAATYDETKLTLLKTKDTVVEKYDQGKESLLNAYSVTKQTVVTAFAKTSAE